MTKTAKPGYTVIEGWDYCGKTSIAINLSAEYENGVYFHSPRGSDQFSNGIYNIITNNLADVSLGTMRGIQIAMNIHNIHRINQLVDDGFRVFADRGILSTLAYQRISMNELAQIWFNLTQESYYSIKQPDQLLLLTATNETIQQRAANRISQLDNWDTQTLTHIDNLMHRYMTNFKESYTADVDKIIVPTDFITEGEVYENIKYILTI